MRAISGCLLRKYLRVYSQASLFRDATNDLYATNDSSESGKQWFCSNTAMRYLKIFREEKPMLFNSSKSSLTAENVYYSVRRSLLFLSLNIARFALIRISELMNHYKTVEDNKVTAKLTRSLVSKRNGFTYSLVLSSVLHRHSFCQHSW